MNVQILERDGKPAFAVLPIEDYERLLEPVENAVDARIIADRLDAVRAGKERTYPAEVVHAVVMGESPVKVFREYRKISMADLAVSCGVSRAHIYQIETGKRSMSIELLKKMVSILDVDADMLL